MIVLEAFSSIQPNIHHYVDFILVPIKYIYCHVKGNKREYCVMWYFKPIKDILWYYLNVPLLGSVFTALKKKKEPAGTVEFLGLYFSIVLKGY